MRAVRPGQNLGQLKHVRRRMLGDPAWSANYVPQKTLPEPHWGGGDGQLRGPALRQNLRRQRLPKVKKPILKRWILQ